LVTRLAVTSMTIGSLVSRWPWFEISAKWANAYLPLPSGVRSWAGRLRRGADGTPLSGHKSTAGRSPLEVLYQFIQEAGVRQGDVLLVHSGATASSALGLGTAAAVELLRGFVGDSGTLVMPTIPLLKGEPQGQNRFNEVSYAGTLVFDVRRSAPWTGVLPRQLMQTPGARRGLNPFNNLTAWGAHVDTLFRSELAEPLQTPCGPGSAWEQLEKLDPLILSINCDFAHSVTMIHRVEEAQIDHWIIPPDRWYRARSVMIKNGETEVIAQLRERRANWSVFFAERNLQRRLINDEVIRQHADAGLNLSCCRASTLLNWARNQGQGFPYLLPRWLI